LGDEDDDHDEDGFVGAGELWNVIRRLEMTEGAAQEDCRRMIAAHDGDDMISFPESRTMWRTISSIIPSLRIPSCSLLLFSLEMTVRQYHGSYI
jgi:hypothetical protein